MPPRLLRPPTDSLLSLQPCGGLTAAPTPLEEPVPITPEQWPEQEHLQELAQEEQEQVALQISLGQLPIFVQRETDMEIAIEYDYP